MKRVLVVVLAVAALASALPRRVQEESEEEESPRGTQLFIVPLERASPRRPPFGFGLPEDLVPPPFEQHPFFRTSAWGAPSAGGGQVDDFMTQMQDMLKEMRKQLTELLQHHPHHDAVLPEGDSSVGPVLGEDDLPKNKSTSTTKVIDGHVVTVNETTYSSGDDNIGAVFRIKVVEVKPEETEDTDAEEPGSPEVLQPEHEPEATTGKSEPEEVEDKHEETNEIPDQKVHDEWGSELAENEIDHEDFSAEEFSPVKERYQDLSADTKVNDFLSDQVQSQGLVMIDPDAEVFSPEERYYHYDREPQPLERLTYL